MDTLKIALMQIAPYSTLEGNLEKGIASCREAKDLSADIALFPEMWSNGYRIYDRPVDRWKAEAISAGSEFVNAFGQLAKERLRRYRESEVHGSAFRRPQKYGLPLDTKKEPPFIRGSCRK